MKYFISSLLLLLIVNLSAQTYTLVGEDVFVGGKKICSIKKTRKGNIMTEAMPEFTVYDINGVDRLLFEGRNGYLMFLDDGKSYLPRMCDANTKSVAEFVSSDSLFTERGYNEAYKKAFIKKHGGVFLGAGSGGIETGITTRDKKKAAYISGNFVKQDGFVIGSVAYLQATASGQGMQVYNVNKKLIGKIFLANADAYSMVKISATGLDGKEKSFSELKGNDNSDAALKWLVDNGYFDDGLTEPGVINSAPTNATVSTTGAPSVQLSPYYSQTTEKLEAMKTEAAKATDYTKAADIKKELDTRAEEAASIKKMEDELAVKVKAEDYSAAATLKEQLKTAKEKKEKKDLLRKEIVEAATAEDYAKADAKKKELAALYGNQSAAVPERSSAFKPVNLNTESANGLSAVVSKSGLIPLTAHEKYFTGMTGTDLAGGALLIYEFDRNKDTITARFSLMRDGKLVRYSPDEFKGVWVYIWRGISNSRFDLEKEAFKATGGEVIFKFRKGEESASEWNKFREKMSGKKAESIDVYFFKNATTIGSRTNTFNISGEFQKSFHDNVQSIGDL